MSEQTFAEKVKAELSKSCPDFESPKDMLHWKVDRLLAVLTKAVEQRDSLVSPNHFYEIKYMNEILLAVARGET